ncbi:MAG: hypothetical protein UU65_C0002G0232 [candidate division CPR2 bacterium GW2011_GWC1_41_48]|uniref:Uncharacterized protein n=1 Tax=candidate division CPR2 bacterium GW2011_GWC1_41_48 TaxID=1618344 RepID=A0A0G0W8X5_UNCC2|nr:MAG: hypothetical protein UT47_C0002G0072 [candidate division CPR2 bacterium GW2011_GWC2_39_35]KKS09454.1 MAG: hypothetical protein UU65_C0002G0232 [candidate division CPR2 bacterium GW2011_GWC1_41_48]
MNEADKKAIEELLNKQTERFNQAMDIRFQEQEEHLEKRMVGIFNEGFEQIVLPHIATLSEKVDSLDSNTERIDRKLNAIVDRQDNQGKEIQGIKTFVQMPEIA